MLDHTNTKPETAETNQEFAQGLRRLRKLASRRGVQIKDSRQSYTGRFVTRPSDHQQTLRVDDRIYMLDSAYASNALHIRLSVRRDRQNSRVILGEWRPQVVVDKTIDLIWKQIHNNIRAHEATLAAAETKENHR